MNSFINNFEIILSHLKELEISFEPFLQIRTPKLSNLELICMNITAEYMSIDSECQLFRVIESTFLADKIERSVYNRRRRRLFGLLDQVRCLLSSKFNEFEDFFVIDSMPLPICRIARANRCKICRDVDSAFPDKGYCASQKTYFFGYKLHGICSVSGVFESIDITPASVHDIHLLEDVKYQLSNCTLLGDKGYLSCDYQLNLFESAHINLQTPMRNNQKDYKKQPHIFSKCRKRIETAYSQFDDQFMIKRNYAKTFEGLKTRILSKLTAMTTIQYLNKFVFNRPINQLKVNLA